MTEKLLVSAKPGRENVKVSGSLFEQLFSDVATTPRAPEALSLKNLFRAVQQLVKSGIVLSGHDISDGGLVTCLVEMALAGQRDSWAGGSRTIHPSGVQPNYMVDKLRVPPHHSKLWQTFYKITRRDEVRAEDIGQVWATGQLAISPAPQKCKQSEGLGRQAGPSNVTAKCPPGHTLKRGLGAPRSDHERSACKETLECVEMTKRPRSGAPNTGSQRG